MLWPQSKMPGGLAVGTWQLCWLFKRRSCESICVCEENQPTPSVFYCPSSKLNWEEMKTSSHFPPTSPQPPPHSKKLPHFLIQGQIKQWNRVVVVVKSLAQKKNGKTLGILLSRAKILQRWQRKKKKIIWLAATNTLQGMNTKKLFCLKMSNTYERLDKSWESVIFVICCVIIEHRNLSNPKTTLNERMMNFFSQAAPWRTPPFMVSLTGRCKARMLMHHQQQTKWLN